MSEVMRTKEIEKYIPHRYPFLFVDAVTLLEPGESARGYKMVSRNEWFFEGHFPEKPLMPGVIMVEALAQLCAVCFLSEEEEDASIGVFTGLDGVRFRRPVRPGERLDLQVKLERRRGPFVKVSARASVDDATAAEGTMSFSLVSDDE